MSTFHPHHQVTHSDHWFARTGWCGDSTDRLHLGLLVAPHTAKPPRRRTFINIFSTVGPAAVFDGMAQSMNDDGRVIARLESL